MEIVIFILFVFLYFLPTIFAINNKKDNSTSIFICNFFSFIIPVIGWILCLAWSVAKDKKQDIVQVFNDQYQAENLGYVRKGDQ